MNIILFYHSLVSDWNHGNAHFLRGIATELIARGNQVKIYEPKDSWSRLNLVSEHGQKPIRMFHEAYPNLDSIPYDVASLDLESALAGADMVIVHEWSDHGLVRKMGEHRRADGNYKLFFHDTHHRMITDRKSMDAYDLSGYDGVLAYGQVLAGIYKSTGRVKNAWTWHEAADTRVFKPVENSEPEGDLVWIGNWGDDERSQELHEFLIGPVKELGLKATVYGVRYPLEAQNALRDAGIQYGGWLPNFEAPKVFSRYKVTVHVPRRPYVEALRGIPTIRPFEALACGIPLISSPWNDSENLFRPGADFLVARDGAEMKSALKRVLADAAFARGLSQSGLETIRGRHTCGHRVDELMEIYSRLSK